MARKINTRELRRPRTIVVGAGITEYWYLKHLKQLLGFNYTLKPSLFGNESMQTIQNRLHEGIEAGATVVCVFDEDVSQWDDEEKRRMMEIHQLYDGKDDVVIAGSMPSIEYWFLLHYVSTNRYFGTSAKVIDVLKKYIPNFSKKEQFLRQIKWVEQLAEGENFKNAYIRAKKFGREGGSYTDMWKAVEKFG